MQICGDREINVIGVSLSEPTAVTLIAFSHIYI